MTANLLAYQRNLEEARHNAAMEQLQGKQIAVSAQQAQASLTQASASMLQASTASYRAAEESRHNLVSERIEKSKMWTNIVDTAVQGAAKIAKTFM